MLNIDWISLTDVFDGVLPDGVLYTVANYLTYIERNISTPMNVAAWALIITSASGVVRSLINIMADIQGKGRFHGIFGVGASIIIAFAFIFAIYLSIIFIITGEWFLNILDEHISFDYIWIWKWLIFILMFALLYFVIFAFYLLTQPKDKPKIMRFPGALLAAVFIVAASIIFSHFISVSTKYTLVYGSLASVMIMLVWLYFCSLIVISGNIFNYELNITKSSQNRRKQKRLQRRKKV
jgi:membrane protein